MTDDAGFCPVTGKECDCIVPCRIPEIQVMDKYITPAPLPTPYERELLTILIEECAEVQQRATKLLRFGRDEMQPGQALTNGYRLGTEIGDVKTMVDLLVNAGVVRVSAIEDGRVNKREQLAKFMQTNRPTP